MSLIHERPDRGQRRAIAVSLLPALGLLFGGLDSTKGGVAACLFACLLVASLLVAAPPPLRMWRRAWPALVLVVVALSWAAACSLGDDPLGISARPIAPDLGVPAMLAAIGGLAALMAGLLVGTRRVALASIIDWLLLFGCAGLSLALIAQTSEHMWEPWRISETGRFLGTVNNANVAGAVYAAFAALASSRIFVDGGALWRDAARLSARARAAAHWIALLLAAGGCALTASRSGVAFGLVALAVIGLRARRRRLRAPVVFVSLGLVGLLAAVAIGQADLLMQRFGGLTHDLDVRLLLWRHNAAIARDAIWHGYGLGSFPVVNLRYFGSLREAQAIWTTNSPHNLPLRLAIEGGLPYLLLICAATLTIGWQIARAARARSLDLHETALLAGIGIIVASSMIDIALEMPAVAALTLSWAGLIWGRAIGSR